MNGTAGIHVYRVLQEALNNVARHSGADRAWVRLKHEAGVLELEVEDHGKGLGPDPGRGLGVVAMRERADLLGGHDRVPAAGRRRHAGAVDGAVGRTESLKGRWSSLKSGHGLRTSQRIRCRQDHRPARRRSQPRAARLPPHPRGRPSIVVVGEASDGEEAIRLAGRAPAARHRDGLRHAGHERADRDAADSRSARRRSPS